jgi:hypothetical protein
MIIFSPKKYKEKMEKIQKNEDRNKNNSYK